METLLLLRLEVGIGDATQDALLERYLAKATKKVINFTKRNKEYVEVNLQEQVIDLAVIIYNRKGSEGLKSQSYSGVSETYDDDIPQSIKRDLYPHRLLKKAVLI